MPPPVTSISPHWSIPYWLISFGSWGYQSPVSFVLDCLYAFFINGSSYHFWFFPALMTAACLVSCFYRSRCRRLLLPVSFLFYALGCFGTAYDQIALRIPLLGQLILSPHFLVIRRYFLMGFPFFASGLLVRHLADRKPSDGALWISVCACAVLWFAEIVVIRSFGTGSDIVITYGLYPLVVSVMLLLLRHPLPEHTQTAAICRSGANFMYYAHPLFITVLNAAAGLMSVRIPETLLFLLVITLTGSISLWIHHAGIPILKKLIQ